MLKYSNWVKTTDRYVAYINIVGLQKLLKESDHYEILSSLDDLQGILSDIDQATTFLGKTSGTKGNRSALVKTALFADAVLLVSRDMSDDAAGHFIGSAMRIQMHLLQNGIGVKGGIASGPFTLDPDNLSFCGLPLAEAISTSKSIEFYGIAQQMEDQSLNGLEELRQIPEGYLPLFYPSFVPTNTGSTVMLLLNIAVCAKQLQDIREFHSNIFDDDFKSHSYRIYFRTIYLFEKAYLFTHHSRSS